jgi:hypothetical protein
VVLGRLRRQGEEALERVGILGVAALRHQRLGMIRLGDIAMALVAADMAGDQLLVMVQTQMLGIGLERKLGAGEAGRHGVAVAFEGHPKLAIGAHRQDPGDIEPARIERLQVRALLGPQLHRPALGLAVQADIGHRLQPEAHCRIEAGEVGQLLGVEEVAFHIAHGPLHPSRCPWRCCRRRPRSRSGGRNRDSGD